MKKTIKAWTATCGDGQITWAEKKRKPLLDFVQTENTILHERIWKTIPCTITFEIFKKPKKLHSRKPNK